MGCASSKQVNATVDIYRPPPNSFAVFDINSIQEPWLTADITVQQHQKKLTHVPTPVLEKLNKFENDAPHSWDEVSKALEDLKPTLNSTNPPEPKPDTPNPQVKHSPVATTSPTKTQAPRKSFSFHTLEELDKKLAPKPGKVPAKTMSSQSELKKAEVPKTASPVGAQPESESGGVIKSVKENIFMVRDRLEREKEGKMANYDKTISKTDPLSEYPEKCPPGGAESAVVYTTSLRGVRRTYEDCCRVRGLLEGAGVVFDERDVSLHGEFLNELRELLGEGARVPRVFVKRRYIGGVEEVVELEERGRLGRILSWARLERGVGWQACGGCGGARFVPCLDCGGSCKVLVEGVKERCGKCNENGLIRCPACASL